MFQPKHCFLKSVSDNNIMILLKDQEETFLGRCPETCIVDKRCSRNQVSIRADYGSRTVTVKHLGGNASSANRMILKNDSHVLKHGETVEFLVGKYPFIVEFSPHLENSEVKNSDKTVKRKNSSIENVEENRCSVSKRVCCLVVASCPSNMWERIEDGKLYVFTSAGVQSSDKIAAYDMDGTVILTKSGRVFPKDKDDWKIANSAVKPKLSTLSSEGYKIVILTNQAGIGRGKTNIHDFKQKIENIAVALGVPVQVFIATSNSIYRKPAPGMWTFLENKKNDGIRVDMKRSFYVGDAAGRIVNWAPGKKKDFSSADRLLAINLNLRFFTPEEHFLNEPPGKFLLPSFNPAILDEDAPLSDKEIVRRNKEVVILVGSPGSGKTHFVLQHLVPAGYVHVNRDTLGSWQKCVQVMETTLAAGRSVVIDNTNPDRESRKRYIDKASAPCRCFVMTTNLDHIRHNVRFRELTDRNHVPVNDMIINSYKNKYEEPMMEEGFAEIVNINFVPCFSDPDHKKLYRMYLLEK